MDTEHPIVAPVTGRQRLVCEFQHVYRSQPSEVIVDFQRGVVGFVRCHQGRPKSFWSMPCTPEEYFECPLSDILAASEVRNRGSSTLRIVTRKGRAAVPEAIMFKKSRNYELLKNVLSQVARSTPDAPFLQTESAAWLALSLIIGFAYVIAYVINATF